MSNFTVDIVQVRGDSFHIGRTLGQHIKNKSLVTTFESTTRPSIDYKSMKSIYATFAPHLLEELEGLSKALKISLNKTASLFSGYDMPKAEALGCSAIGTKDYYVRNYDFSPFLYDCIFSLIQPETSFATAAYNLQLIGRHDGVNEEGLVAGLHFVSNDGYTKGVSAWTAVRMVLDSCSSTDEAIAMLKEIPHAACYNFSLGDKNGNMAVVEASPDKVLVRQEQSILSCVNHFQIDMLQNKNRSSIDQSIQRNENLLNIASANNTFLEIFHYFKNPLSPIFFTDYDDHFGTLHTFAYSYDEAKILTAIARSEQVLEVNFQDWVKGEDINEVRLVGLIK